jgi:hypothetical protein
MKSSTEVIRNGNSRLLVVVSIASPAVLQHQTGKRLLD